MEKEVKEKKPHKSRKPSIVASVENELGKEKIAALKAYYTLGSNLMAGIVRATNSDDVKALKAKYAKLVAACDKKLEGYKEEDIKRLEAEIEAKQAELKELKGE